MTGNNSVLSIKNLNKDIDRACLIAIVYGVVGVIFSCTYPFFTASVREILSPRINFGSLDLLWNFVTNIFLILWGVQAKKKEKKKLLPLTNLLGLFFLKLSIVLGTMFLGVFQIVRAIYLLPAIFFIFLGWIADIKIKKYTKAIIQERYKLRLMLWAFACVLFLFVCLIGGFVSNNSNPLVEALEARNASAVIMAVKNGENPNGKIMGRPLLFLGIDEGDAFNVKALLSAGANVDSKSNWGRTALHEAALHGQLEIAKILLDQGANVNAKNNRGETPLFYAEGGLIAGPKQTKHHREVAKLLIDHGAIEGANIKTEAMLEKISKDFNQKTPIQIDVNTQLDSVISYGNILTYKYTLLNLSLDNSTQAEIDEIKETFKIEMTPKLKNSICKEDSMKPLKERGVEFRYLYFDNNGNEMIRIDIKSTDYE